MITIIIGSAPIFQSFYYIRQNIAASNERRSKYADIEKAGYIISKQVINSCYVWMVEIADEAEAAMFKLTYL